MVFDVEIKSLPSIKVLSLRGIIPVYRDEGILWEKLGRFIGENQITPSDCGGYSTYFDKEYKEENPDVEIAVPVATFGKNSGKFVCKKYPAIPKAATVRFSDPFEGGYDTACESLPVGWRKTVIPLTEISVVIVSPYDDNDPEKWLTELQVPIKKA